MFTTLTPMLSSQMQFLPHILSKFIELKNSLPELHLSRPPDPLRQTDGQLI